MRKIWLALVAAVVAAFGVVQLSRRRGMLSRRPVWSLVKRVSLFRTAYLRIASRYMYDLITMHAPDTMTFMNYGYAVIDEAESAPTLLPDDEPNRLSIQLYMAVIGGTDLKNKDVLEIGCGRGGGSDFIARNYAPHRMVGLDLAEKAVSFCRAHYHQPSLSFEAGNAEALPFPDASFDIVVNVESSHGYPSMERFLTEVWRVLRPGGAVLFADIRRCEQVDALRMQIRDARFAIVEEEAITANVVKSLDLQSESRLERIENIKPRFAQHLLHMRDFAAVHGSATYQLISAGQFEYWRFVLRKPSQS